MSYQRPPTPAEGNRLGNWLTKEQAKELLQVPGLSVPGLTRTPALVRHPTEVPSTLAGVASTTKALKTAKSVKRVAPPVVSPQTPKPARKTGKDARTRRVSRASKPAETSGAVAKSVPSRPVVFYPGRPFETQPIEPAAKAEQESAAPTELNPVDLDAQSLALRARWRRELGCSDDSVGRWLDREETGRLPLDVLRPYESEERGEPESRKHSEQRTEDDASGSESG